MMGRSHCCFSAKENASHTSAELQPQNGGDEHSDLFVLSQEAKRGAATRCRAARLYLRRMRDARRRDDQRSTSRLARTTDEHTGAAAQSIRRNVTISGPWCICWLTDPVGGQKRGMRDCFCPSNPEAICEQGQNSSPREATELRARPAQYLWRKPEEQSKEHSAQQTALPSGRAPVRATSPHRYAGITCGRRRRRSAVASFENRSDQEAVGVPQIA